MVLLQKQFILRKPVAGAPANACDVLSGLLNGKQLKVARTVVLNLLHPNVKGRTALANINLDFLVTVE